MEIGIWSTFVRTLGRLASRRGKSLFTSNSRQDKIKKNPLPDYCHSYSYSYSASLPGRRFPALVKNIASQSARIPCSCSMSSSPAKTLSPTKRQLSTSPAAIKTAKSPDKKKVKVDSGEEQSENIVNMPGVELSGVVAVESGAGEVLKEIGNKGSPTKALKAQPQEEEGVDRLYFVKMTEKAHAPTKGSKLAAGYDLKSAYACTVPARGHFLVKTDIQVKVPSGTYGRVAPRSGLALKNKIDVGAGVIDADYRGNVGVILFNHSDEDFVVNEGDRVAQLICEAIRYPEAVEVKNLEETERGEGGFGSTGISGGTTN